MLVPIYFVGTEEYKFYFRNISNLLFCKGFFAIWATPWPLTFMHHSYVVFDSLGTPLLAATHFTDKLCFHMLEANVLGQVT